MLLNSLRSEHDERKRENCFDWMKLISTRIVKLTQCKVHVDCNLILAPGPSWLVLYADRSKISDETKTC